MNIWLDKEENLTFEKHLAMPTDCKKEFITYKKNW